MFRSILRSPVLNTTRAYSTVNAKQLFEKSCYSKIDYKMP